MARFNQNQSLQLELSGQEKLELEGLHQSPILCGPFEEPNKHWEWNRDNRLVKREWRRPSGYFYKTERTGTAQLRLEGIGESSEKWDELQLPNLLREDVRAWRDSGYKNPSPTVTTRRLLEHWFEPHLDNNPDAASKRKRERRFFFCQREAVETLIYLAELRLGGARGTRGLNLGQDDLERLLRGEKPNFHSSETAYQFPTLADFPADRKRFPLELRRAVCKMATGSGKTVVMAMLIAWSLCNSAYTPHSEVFPSVALVCAPNLTVKERLQVLRPGIPGNYYETFDIVPDDLMTALKRGCVVVENWHSFAPRDGHEEGGVRSRVVNKGVEGPEEVARRVLGEAFGRWPLLVFNDEGHHAWRPAPPLKGEGKADKDEEEEATVWTTGLDIINNAREERDAEGNPKRGIALCMDLSATPFFISGSGHPEGAPFPWIVSDFGLTDAIESGIVKIPRVPVADDSGRAIPKYFKLWQHLKDHAQSTDKQAGGKKLKPEYIFRESQDALIQLAAEWKRSFDTLREQNSANGVPPVLIVVCDNTDVAQIFYEKISGEREEEQKGKKVKLYRQEQMPGALEEFQNEEGITRTIRIDTKLLALAESDDPKVKRSDAAEALRRVVATVGRKGEPGEQIRCVISVAMLTEGWDASNVTHILGVRAFGSQLLCEQVVGRGLRRMSYEVGENGRLPEEYADVYGIPFSIVPFRGKAKGDSAPVEAPMQRVYAVPERAHLALSFPVVEGYAFALRNNKIRCCINTIPQLSLVSDNTPGNTMVAPVVMTALSEITAVGTPFEMSEQNRKWINENIHLQTIKFYLARTIADQLAEHRPDMKHVARYQLFPQVFRYVDAYVGMPEAERGVLFRGNGHGDLILERYFQQVVTHFLNAIEPDTREGELPLLPVLYRFRPYTSTHNVNFVTRRPLFQQIKKSHLSAVVSDTQSWEQATVFALENSSLVECYARNDRLGLRIPYEFLGASHYYEPDFLVRLVGGKMFLLETKGRETEQDKAKRSAAAKWLRAVNYLGRVRGEDKGKQFHEELVMCYEPKQLPHILAQTFGAEVFPVPKINFDEWRDAVGIYFIHYLHSDSHFGRTKLQKLLYFAEATYQLPLGGEYVRQAAGPLDTNMIYPLEVRGEENRWFVTEEWQSKGKSGVHYHPDVNFSDALESSHKILGDKVEDLDKLIRIFGRCKTETAEMHATLYAAWNDLLLAGKPANEKAILDEVWNNWHAKKQDIPHTVWRNTLDRMKAEGFQPPPSGSGPKTIQYEAN